MRSSNLLEMGDEAYELERSVVQVLVKTEIGNYAFGYMDNKEFIVQYVGRCDSNTQSKILQKLEDERLNHLTHFKFSHGAETPKDAFEKECRNYHEFGKDKYLYNNNHPARPANEDDLVCPIEGCGK